MIEPGTILRSPNGDSEVLSLEIYRNNDREWDCLARLDYRGQELQVLLREIIRALKRGWTYHPGKERPPRPRVLHAGDSPYISKGAQLRSGGVLFKATRVVIAKNLQGKWDAIATLQNDDDDNDRREVAMSELGEAIDQGEFEIVG